MPRARRRNIPRTVYHCIWRFVDQSWLLRDDEERATFLRFLGKAMEESDWRCLAYALMSSHIHLAMIAGQSPMQSWTKRVNSPFANWLNERHDRLGPVFADRGKDYGFVSHRVGGVLAYIHNNPVRAGVVDHARQSTWTSHRSYVGLVRPPSWLGVEEGLRRAGCADGASFDTYVENTLGERCDAEFDTYQKDLRRRGAIDVGTPTTDGDQSMFPLLAAPYAHIRPDPREVIERVADATAVSVPLICSRRRLPVIRAARTAAVKAGLSLGLSKSELARALGISPQAVHLISQREVTDTQRRVIELVYDQMEVERWGRRRSA